MTEFQPRPEKPLSTKFDHPFKASLDRNWMRVAAGITLVGFIATAGLAFLTGRLLEQESAATWASGSITAVLTIFTAWMGYNTVQYFLD